LSSAQSRSCRQIKHTPRYSVWRASPSRRLDC